MTLPQTLSTFSRLEGILKRIAEEGKEAELKTSSPGAAVRLRAEIYRYRKLIRGDKWRSTPYDNFRLSIKADNPCVVLVKNAPDVEITFLDRKLDVLPDPLVEEIKGEKPVWRKLLDSYAASGAFPPDKLWDMMAPKVDAEELTAAFLELGIEPPGMIGE